MVINVTAELYAFAVVVLGTVCVCVLFDFFRELLSVFCVNKLFCAVTDIVFWSFTSGFMWMCLLKADNGRLRGYQIIGCILGGILYFFTISFVFRLIFKNFFKIFKLIFKILLTPVRFLYKILYRVIHSGKLKIILIFKKVRNKKCRKKKRQPFRLKKRDSA